MKDMNPMIARDLMTSHVLTCPAHESLALAAQVMWDADVGVVAVVDDQGRISGVITDRDVCMAAYTQGRLLRDMVIAEVMCKAVVSCGPDDSIGHIEELMRRHQVRRIPVVDAERRLLGIVSSNDLARAVHGSRRGQSDLVVTLAAIGHPRQSLSIPPAA